MSEQGGYDPFSDEDKPKTVTESQVIHDPMEELLSGTHEAVAPEDELGDSGASFAAADDDGWAPVEEEKFTISQAMAQDADPMASPAMNPLGSDPLAETLEEAATPADIQFGSGVFDVAPPTHSNLLPVGEPVDVPATPESTRVRPVQSPIHAPDSNEAILQSGVNSAVGSGSRAALPTKEDAPPPPVHKDENTASWAIPTAVGVLGSGAGVYVLLGANPILGGIFVALSVVGALFLRVLLKD